MSRVICPKVAEGEFVHVDMSIEQPLVMFIPIVVLFSLTLAVCGGSKKEDSSQPVSSSQQSRENT